MLNEAERNGFPENSSFHMKLFSKVELNPINNYLKYVNEFKNTI